MRRTLTQESYKKGSPADYEDSLRVLYGGRLDSYILGIQFLLDLGVSFENRSVLELCCGTGLASQEIVARRPASFLAVDVIPSFVSFAEQRVRQSLIPSLEQDLHFLCKDVFSLTEKDFLEKKLDTIIVCNAATELESMEKLFSFVYHNLDSLEGIFLFNVKVKDEKKTVYEMVYETLVREHQKDAMLSRSQRLEGLRDGRVVHPQLSEKQVLKLLSRTDFRVQLCYRCPFSFSPQQLQYYTSRAWNDYQSLLKGIHTQGSDDSQISRWIHERTDDRFFNFDKACSSSLQECSHMKTELFIRAEKGSFRSYSTLC